MLRPVHQAETAQREREKKKRGIIFDFLDFASLISVLRVLFSPGSRGNHSPGREREKKRTKKLEKKNIFDFLICNLMSILTVFSEPKTTRGSHSPDSTEREKRVKFLVASC